MAELAIEKKPTTDNRVGVRVDVDYGPGAKIAAALDGSSTFSRNIQQAYVSYLNTP